MHMADSDQRGDAWRKAEDMLSTKKKKAVTALSADEKSRLAENEKTARLRALRLAKEAADKEAAARALAEKRAAGGRRTKRSRAAPEDTAPASADRSA
jgi:hypothetical protein